ncbi:hypothetical protein [Herbaspirillum sp.]|uniref:hypothetical protein n=1 Tax=Herbaspirillum sp. TaxID=1890675 RepID=UPI000C0B1FE7|nr:hypothetical protein [Herbaspirillum sp.]MAF04705.1 hypothetical protein [Herbaspirillum sp.]
MRALKISFLLLLCTTALPSARCESSKPSEWERGVRDTLSESQSINFQQLQEGVRRQADSVISHIQPGQVAESLNVVRSQAVDGTAARISQANRASLAQADDSAIAKAKAALPKVSPDLYRGPKSPYFTTSKAGMDVINVIRALPRSSGTKRGELLAQIRSYSDAGLPEAVNFVGFIFEYGLFGAKKDLERALALYSAAGSRGYQPAMYNLANFHFYGKTGSQDLATTLQTVGSAYALGGDTSGRVCGLGAYASFRAGNAADAMRYATGCTSPLAKLPLAAFDQRITSLDRIRMLRETLNTGADDGFPLMHRIAAKDAKVAGDSKCRYELLARFKLHTPTNGLLNEASACLQRFGGLVSERSARDVANSVDVEVRAIEMARQQNQFHYSWSVPYLPFPTAETGLFLPLINHTQK